MIPTTSFDTSDELDSVLRTLSQRHARAVCLYYRFNSTEVASMDDLVQFIREHDERATDERTVEIRLHHATLPKLADAGVIDYTSQSDRIRYREPESIEVWVDHAVEAGEITL